MKVTSDAYHESTIGLKNDVYSFARTRFSLVTVAANSSFLLVEDVVDPVTSVVDMKNCFECVEEDGGQNASVEAKRSSSELRLKSVTAIFVMVVASMMEEQLIKRLKIVVSCAVFRCP